MERFLDLSPSHQNTKSSATNFVVNPHVSGFTLLEVMLAMAVFAVAGLAVMSSARLSLGALTRLEESTYATWVASNALAELKLEKKWPALSWKDEKEEMVGHEWHWRWRGVKTEDPNFIMVEVEVRENKKDENPITTLITYFGK